MHRTPNRPSRGFALIEALVAAAIFAAGTLALVRLQATLLRYAEAAQQRSEAAQLAQSRLDELRAMVQWLPLGSALPAAAGERDAHGVSGRDTPNGMRGDAFDRRWRIHDDAALGLRRIDLRVRWTDRDGRAEPQPVDLTLLIAPRDAAELLRVARAH